MAYWGATPVIEQTTIPDYIWPTMTIALSDVTVIDLYPNGQVIVNHGWPDPDNTWFLSWSELPLSELEMPTMLFDGYGRDRGLKPLWNQEC